MSDGSETLLAVFDGPRRLAEGVEAMLKNDNDVLDVLSPFPIDEIDKLLPQRPSLVRWFTLLGCISGAVLGMAFQVMTVLQWPHLTGGKPVISLPAFVIVSFEMTILFGAIATFVGLIVNAGLPQIRREYFHSGSSRGDFALVVRSDPSDFESIEAALRDAGAHDVRPADPESAWLGITEK